VPPGQEKFSPAFRALLADPEAKAQPRRLEVILALTPPEGDRSWLPLLRPRGSGIVVEGQIGPLVTVYGPPAAVADLARFPEVAVIRLPRLARQDALPDLARDPAAVRPLLSPGARLHALPRGAATRVAVVDSNFRGWEAEKEQGRLPANVRLIDLTAERNPDLRPDPYPDGPGPGGGTAFALALARLHPDLDLVLVRVDPAAPYMLQAVAAAINGAPRPSINLDNRLEELQFRRGQLAVRRDQLLLERRVVLSDPREEEEPLKRREKYFKDQAAFDREQQEFDARQERYLQFGRDLRALRGINLVVSGLVWNEGYGADEAMPLGCYFDDRPFRAATWFQAVGDVRGQAWSGYFRDADGNRVMEFAPPEAPLPPGSWTRELNFLAWRPRGGEVTPALPEKVRLRLTLQWKEAHDPNFLRIGEDAYRLPLADLRLVVLFQPDPAGEKRPADDLEVVAQSSGPGYRLEAVPNRGTYELVVPLDVNRPGRYAVRIEGRAPDGILPPGAAALPAARRVGELRPRLLVETLEGPGRALLQDFATDEPVPGIPGDGREVLPLRP
jgi:hypothetical protein